MVFASDMGVFVANSDGSAVTRLTRGMFDQTPAWSPDDAQIAFERLTGGNNDAVLVMDADGTHLRRLGFGNDVEWAPDGSKLLFDRSDASSVDSVFVSNPDGSGLERLATGWGGDWSPDGKQIVYASGSPGEALGVIGIDQRTGFQVPGGEPADWEWSPDGSLIAYALREDPTVYLLNPVSGAVRSLARAAGPVDWVDWSPDGSEIAIHAGNEVDLVTAASGQLHLLSPNADQPLWSPDGSRIAFTSRQVSHAEELRTIDRNGSDRRVITAADPCTSVSLSFDWGGNDDTLLFEKPRSAGDGCDLWLANLGTGTQAPITNAFPSGGDFSDPVWAATTVVAHPEARRLVTPQPAESVPTTATVFDLAADGAHAAIDTGSQLGTVSIWTRGKALRKVAGSGVDYARLQLVAAAGRVAWTEDNGGAPPTYFLTVVDDAGNPVYNDSSYLGTDELGEVTGDGPLLVYATWHFNDVSGGTKLWRIAGKHRQLLRRWPDNRDIVAVDAGRIAVLNLAGRLVILNAAGHPLASFRVPGAAGGAASAGLISFRLTGGRLLVLHKDTLDVRNATNGTLERQWPLAAADGPVSLRGAHGDIAVYTEGIAIHLLRLSTGRDVVLQLPNEQGPAVAALPGDGLYYTYNQGGSSQHGRLNYITPKELTRLLARQTP